MSRRKPSSLGSKRRGLRCGHYGRSVRPGFRRLVNPSTLTYLIGIPTIVLAGVVSYRESQSVVLPALTTMVAIFVCLVIFLLSAGESYASLVASGIRPRARATFLRSQLVKYIPGGGVAQFASQVGQLGVGRREGSALVIHSKLVAAAGGFAWGPILAIAGDSLPTLVRVGFGLLGLGVVVAWPPAFRFVARRVKLLGPDDVFEPSGVIVGVLWSILSVGVAGFAFHLALGDPSLDVMAVIAAYAVAWTVGYLAVPFPGGIGVREGVLTFLLPIDAGSLLIAAVVVRLLQIVAELGLALALAPVLDKSESESDLGSAR